MVETVVERFGAIDILVNNAQSPAPGSLLDIDESTYRGAFESGSTAMWRLMRACHPHLVGGGAVVNLGSAAGIRWNPSGPVPMRLRRKRSGDRHRTRGDISVQ